MRDHALIEQVASMAEEITSLRLRVQALEAQVAGKLPMQDERLAMPPKTHHKLAKDIIEIHGQQSSKG